MEKFKTFLKSIPIISHFAKWVYKLVRYKGAQTQIIENIMCKLENISRQQMELSCRMHLFFERKDKESVDTLKKGGKPFLKNRGGNKISIIIPGYNKVDYTIMCLKALKKHTPEELDYEVIVVDDCSIEKLEDVLPETVPEEIKHNLRILRNKENLGFGQSVNKGVREAKGNIIVLLNNDAFVTKGWLEAFLSTLDRDDAGIIGGKYLYPDGTIQHAGGVFYYGEEEKTFIPYHIYRGFRGNFPGVNKRRHFKFVSFACVMMRRQLFESLGGLDEAFENSCEDVDFCLRAIENGYSVLYEPKSVVYHLECSTRGYENPQDIVNLELLKEKHNLKAEDDFHYYIEDGIPTEYGREYSNRWFIEKIREMPFGIETFNAHI